jgi:uncharacterized protein (UPF0276 family)
MRQDQAEGDRVRRDRVGLGWRPELAAAIFDALDRIDVLEVIAEHYLDVPRRERDALKLLARDVPLHIHGVELGLAGVEEVDTARLDRLARLVADVEPEAWSEHLAFVRAGGVEIGHLAAPPRNDASVAGAAENIRKAARIVGSLPLMENIATLVEPPLSTLSEADWIADIVRASGCGLLLDLHNVHANAANFAYHPMEFLARIPLERVGAIHIAGGKWITSPGGRQVLLDDHLHEVTEPVYQLLAEVAAHASQPLTVILERDGDYPAIDVLMGELDRARAALAAGRRRQRHEEQAHAG